MIILISHRILIECGNDVHSLMMKITLARIITCYKQHIQNINVTNGWMKK